MSVNKNHRLLSQPIALAGQPLARGWYIASALLLFIALSALFGAAPVAQAASITVTGAADVVADDGVCALREAIIAANTDTPSGATPGECPAGSGPDAIILVAGTTYTLTEGQLAVASAITVQGNGAMIQRSRAGGTPEFRIFNVSSAGDLVLEDLTVSNGSAGFGGGIESFGMLALINSTVSGNTALNGGGIRNAGTATLTNSTVSGNMARLGGGINNTGAMTLTSSAVSGNQAQINGGGILNGGTLTLAQSVISSNDAVIWGGGIYNPDGTLTLTNTTIKGNIAALLGGGIFNDGGTVTLTDSSVGGNASHDSGAGAVNAADGELTLVNSAVSGNNADVSGGGIFNLAGAVTLSNSTVSGNTAQLDGGGIINASAVTLSNSTISGNTANERGGGIFNGGASGTVALTSFTTFSDNTAPTGGGIYVESGTGRLELFAAIIAHSGPGGNCAGAVEAGLVSLGHNIASDDTCNLIHSADQPSTSPLLDVLQDNGGPTRTHSLLPGSPAIDTIPLASCKDLAGNPLATDQRGVPRPQGERCDIGAVEVRQRPLGDLNCDGALDIRDVILLLQRIIGVVSKLEPCVV